MTFAIPTANHLFQADWDVDGRRRGPFDGTGEAQWNTRNTKVNGSLPITGSAATGFVNTTTTGFAGCWWTFNTSFDVSTDTKVCVFLYQYNAPNRLELETKANNGIVLRLGTGTATTTVGPTNYRTFQAGGRDTKIGKERAFPVHLVVDLNSASHDATIGTFDNTDVEFIGFGSKTLNMGGTTTQVFLQRMFVLDTTKGATNIPRFTGSGSDWDDTITAMGTAYNTKITHGWLGREGTIFSVACPIEIGNNSTITTFNDNGASVFWPNHNVAADPSTRVTDQAFRVYLNLRNNVADTATFSGFYNAGDSNPPWDFDQDDNAVVTFNGPTFVNTGRFDVGSSITGDATWDNCGIVWCNDNSVDLDGSVFTKPSGDHLLRLEP